MMRPTGVMSSHLQASIVLVRYLVKEAAHTAYLNEDVKMLCSKRECMVFDALRDLKSHSN